MCKWQFVCIWLVGWLVTVGCTARSEWHEHLTQISSSKCGFEYKICSYLTVMGCANGVYWLHVVTVWRYTVCYRTVNEHNVRRLMLMMRPTQFDIWMSYLNGTAYRGHCRQVLLTCCLLDMHCLGYKIEVMSRDDHGSDGSVSHSSCPLCDVWLGSGRPQVLTVV
jgi:hypothetical protein